MPDTYMGTGYKSDRAREEAGAVKRSFVAPGFPIEVVPSNLPPPPPPVAGAAGAAAGGASVTALGLPSGILAGLGLGAWVKADIDKWKREASLPFYDTDYDYRPGTGWQTAWDESSAPEYGDYDPDWDQKLREWIDRQVRKAEPFWKEGEMPHWIFPEWSPPDPDFYGPGDIHGPVFRIGNSWRYWVYRLSCGSNPQSTHWVSRVPATSGGFCAGYGPYTVVNNNAEWTNCGNLLAVSAYNDGVTSPVFHCPTAIVKYAEWVAGFTKVSPGIINGYDGWDSRQSFTNIGVDSLPYGAGRLRYGIQLDTRTADWPGLSWKRAAAPANTQPSLEQQAAAERLPRGKAQRGFYVPLRLDAPLTIISAAPARGPVTVPDTVIWPEPGGGGAILTPPSHPPEKGRPSRGKEKKLNIRSGFAGVAFVALNFATEWYDAVYSWWDTLPEWARTTNPTGGRVDAVQMMEDMYYHFGLVDWEKGLENFINNQFEDLVYAQPGRLAGRASAGIGVTTGLGRALRGRNDTSVTVPEIHFADGEWSLSWGDWEIRADDDRAVGGYD